MATGTIPKSVKATLYIDGKPAEQSIKSVEQVTRSLEREIKSLTIGTAEWNAKMKQLGDNKKYLAELRAEANGLGGAFNKIKSELGALGTLAAGYLGFQFISSQFQNIISGNAKLSDSLADIRRVTGLTEAGVLNLDSALGKLDTRTSKSGLREIAVIAGKLGVAKNDILGFVEATDKLVVSLGDELGNADEVTTQLGKILNVFDGTVNGDNITRLGNAMVKLANDGVASGAFIANFTQQVSGVAKSANLSLGATLALGAGLEELGGRAESSATAVQKLLISIAKDIPGAAQIAKVPLKEFTELFGTKPEQALLKYTAGLVKNKSAFSDIAESLTNAGEDGARVVTAITAIGQKTEFFTDKINGATEALQGYNEINSAFALKNETLGGQIDRLGKSFNKLTANTTLIDILTKLVVTTVNFVNWIDRNMEAIRNITKAVIIAGLAWGAYRLAVLLATTEKKAWITTLISAEALETLAIIRTTTWGLVTATLTGNFKKAAQELKALTVIMNASPWGLVAGAVVALGAALYLYSGRATTASKIQNDLNDVLLESKKRSQEEMDQLRQLDAIRIDSNSTLSDKYKALDRIRQLYPDILKGLTNEEALTNKGTEAIRRYIEMLDKKSTAEAASDKIKELKSRNLDLKENQGDADLGYGEIIGGYLSGGSYNTIAAEKRKKEFEENKQRIKELQNQYGEAIRAQLLGGTDSNSGGGGAGGGGGGGGNTGGEKKTDKIADDYKKLQEELNKISFDITKDQLEGYDKEVYEAGVKYEKLTALAHGNKEKLAEIYKAEYEEIEAIGKKYQEKASEKLKKEYQEKLDAFGKFKEDLFQDNLNPQQREESDAGTKYETAWQQLYAFKQAGVITEQQFNQIELELQEKLQKDILGIKEKYRKEDFDKQQKIDEDKKQLQLDYAQLISDSVFSIMSNSARARSDEALAQIETQRERELSSKNLTEAQKQKINDKYDAQARVEKLRAWKAEQRAALGQALINGALAVIKALPNIPLATYAGIASAANLAIIAAQKPPKFAVGGFSDKDPAGYVSNSTIFTNSASGRDFEAGEAGREWIAPNWMLTDPRFGGIIENLEVARKDKRSFAMGGYNGASTSTNSGNNSTANLERLMMQMIETQKEVNDKKVVLSMRTFQEAQNEIVEVINNATG